jgi:hypothetical protein
MMLDLVVPSLRPIRLPVGLLGLIACAPQETCCRFATSARRVLRPEHTIERIHLYHAPVNITSSRPMTASASEEDFHRDLSDNLYEFSLLCGDFKDVARIGTASGAKWTFLLLLELIHETEVFVSSANVHCFRLEDFKSDATREFKRLIYILAPDSTPKCGYAPSPPSSSSRYQSGKENVSSYRALMVSLPADIARRIEALGYSM